MTCAVAALLPAVVGVVMIAGGRVAQPSAPATQAAAAVQAALRAASASVNVNTRCDPVMNIDITYDSPPTDTITVVVIVNGSEFTRLTDDDDDLMGFHPVVTGVPPTGYTYEVRVFEGSQLIGSRSGEQVCETPPTPTPPTPTPPTPTPPTPTPPTPTPPTPTPPTPTPPTPTPPTPTPPTPTPPTPTPPTPTPPTPTPPPANRQDGEGDRGSDGRPGSPPGVTAVDAGLAARSGTGHSARPTPPARLRLDGISARLVRGTPVDGTLTPPADPALLGWWGRPFHAASGTTLVVGHTVHTGGGALEDLGDVAVGSAARVDGVRYRVTRVSTISKAELTRRAPRLFAGDGLRRLVVVTCADYNAATGTFDSNVVLVAKPPGASVRR